ncbi:MAG: transposase [Acidimicrobiaceae bacterium]|nr:transposase [Acidimicrobiaceae bacterium]
MNAGDPPESVLAQQQRLGDPRGRRPYARVRVVGGTRRRRGPRRRRRGGRTGGGACALPGAEAAVWVVRLVVVGERAVVLVDLPTSGRPVRLVWHKRCWRRPQRGCGAGSVAEQNSGIAPCPERLTTRAGRWATRQAGRGRAVGDVASALGCGWHTVNASVRRWGHALLEAGTSRVSVVTALGLDETLFVRRGRYRAKAWSTSIVDVASGQLLDIVPGRTAKEPARRLSAQPASRRQGIRWAALDLSGPYRAGFGTALPHARQVLYEAPAAMA